MQPGQRRSAHRGGLWQAGGCRHRDAGALLAGQTSALEGSRVPEPVEGFPSLMVSLSHTLFLQGWRKDYDLLTIYDT